MTHQVDRERWSKMSIFDQMGNIYSEVGRSFNAKKRHSPRDMDMAVERAIDLFDATVDGLIQAKSPKAKEVLRAKEEYLKAVYPSKITPKEIESLDRYFLQFAIAARLAR